MFPVSLLGWPLTVSVNAALRELGVVRQLELDFLIVLILLGAGHVFEVLLLGYVEINHHQAVVRQGRKDVPLLDQAAELLVQAIDNAVERAVTDA